MDKFKAGDWVINEYGAVSLLTDEHFQGVSKRSEEYFNWLNKWKPEIGEWICYPIWIDKTAERYEVARYKPHHKNMKCLLPKAFIDTLGD